MGILNKLQIKNKLFLSNDKRFVCGGALSTAAEPSNRLQHSDTEFQRFPQRTLSPISLIMSINIHKRVSSVENLPERSTSLPGASSQCGTLHLNSGKRRGQEPSRGHKLSILENFLPHGTASCSGVRCPKPCFIILIMTDQRRIYSNCQNLQVH